MVSEIDKQDYLGLALVVIGSMVLGGMAGSSIKEGNIQKQAIEQGCAQHNPKTGNFEWVKK